MRLASLGPRSCAALLAGVVSAACASGGRSGPTPSAAGAGEARSRTKTATPAASADATPPVQPAPPNPAAILDRVARGLVRLIVTRPADARPAEPIAAGARPAQPIPAGARPSGTRAAPTADAGKRGSPTDGSGVLLARDGTVVTNAHVVRGATRIDAIAWDGRAFEVSVVAADDATDLAVLRLRGDRARLEELEPIEWAKDPLPRVGEAALVVGNAFGTGTTASAGIVAAIARSGLGHARYEDFIVTDARVARGSSGGALVDAAGKLIGISTGTWVDGPAGVAFGLAVSARLARPVVLRLGQGQLVSRGNVGIDADDLDPARARELGVDGVDGAVITAVDVESAAERAGVRRGDVVVMANGWTIGRRGHLRAALSTVEDGATVTLVVLRGGARIDVTLTASTGAGSARPAALPAAPPAALPAAPPAALPASPPVTR